MRRPTESMLAALSDKDWRLYNFLASSPHRTDEEETQLRALRARLEASGEATQDWAIPIVERKDT